MRKMIALTLSEKMLLVLYTNTLKAIRAEGNSHSRTQLNNLTCLSLLYSQVIQTEGNEVFSSRLHTAERDEKISINEHLETALKEAQKAAARLKRLIGPEDYPRDKDDTITVFEQARIIAERLPFLLRAHHSNTDRAEIANLKELVNTNLLVKDSLDSPPENIEFVPDPFIFAEQADAAGAGTLADDLNLLCDDDVIGPDASLIEEETRAIETTPAEHIQAVTAAWTEEKYAVVDAHLQCVLEPLNTDEAKAILSDSESSLTKLLTAAARHTLTRTEKFYALQYCILLNMHKERNGYMPSDRLTLLDERLFAPHSLGLHTLFTRATTYAFRTLESFKTAVNRRLSHTPPVTQESLIHYATLVADLEEAKNALQKIEKELDADDLKRLACHRAYLSLEDTRAELSTAAKTQMMSNREQARLMQLGSKLTDEEAKAILQEAHAFHPQRAKVVQAFERGIEQFKKSDEALRTFQENPTDKNQAQCVTDLDNLITEYVAITELENDPLVAAVPLEALIAAERAVDAIAHFIKTTELPTLEGRVRAALEKRLEQIATQYHRPLKNKLQALQNRAMEVQAISPFAAWKAYALSRVEKAIADDTRVWPAFYENVVAPLLRGAKSHELASAAHASAVDSDPKQTAQNPGGSTDRYELMRYDPRGEMGRDLFEVAMEFTHFNSTEELRETLPFISEQAPERRMAHAPDRRTEVELNALSQLLRRPIAILTPEHTPTIYGDLAEADIATDQNRPIFLECVDNNCYVLLALPEADTSSGHAILARIRAHIAHRNARTANPPEPSNDGTYPPATLATDCRQAHDNLHSKSALLKDKVTAFLTLCAELSRLALATIEHNPRQQADADHRLIQQVIDGVHALLSLPLLRHVLLRVDATSWSASWNALLRNLFQYAKACPDQTPTTAWQEILKTVATTPLLCRYLDANLRHYALSWDWPKHDASFSLLSAIESLHLKVEYAALLRPLHKALNTIHTDWKNCLRGNEPARRLQTAMEELKRTHWYTIYPWIDRLLLLFAEKEKTRFQAHYQQLLMSALQYDEQEESVVTALASRPTFFFLGKRVGSAERFAQQIAANSSDLHHERIHSAPEDSNASSLGARAYRLKKQLPYVSPHFGAFLMECIAAVLKFKQWREALDTPEEKEKAAQFWEQEILPRIEQIEAVLIHDRQGRTDLTEWVEVLKLKQLREAAQQQYITVLADRLKRIMNQVIQREANHLELEKILQKRLQSQLGAANNSVSGHFKLQPSLLEELLEFTETLLKALGPAAYLVSMLPIKSAAKALLHAVEHTAELAEKCVDLFKGLLALYESGHLLRHHRHDSRQQKKKKQRDVSRQEMLKNIHESVPADMEGFIERLVHRLLQVYADPLERLTPESQTVFIEYIVKFLMAYLGMGGLSKESRNCTDHRRTIEELLNWLMSANYALLSSGFPVNFKGKTLHTLDGRTITTTELLSRTGLLCQDVNGRLFRFWYGDQNPERYGYRLALPSDVDFLKAYIQAGYGSGQAFIHPNTQVTWRIHYGDPLDAYECCEPAFSAIPAKPGITMGDRMARSEDQMAVSRDTLRMHTDQLMSLEKRVVSLEKRTRLVLKQRLKRLQKQLRVLALPAPMLAILQDNIGNIGKDISVLMEELLKAGRKKEDEEETLETLEKRVEKLEITTDGLEVKTLALEDKMAALCVEGLVVLAGTVETQAEKNAAQAEALDATNARVVVLEQQNAAKDEKIKKQGLVIDQQGTQIKALEEKIAHQSDLPMQLLASQIGKLQRAIIRRRAQGLSTNDLEEDLAELEAIQAEHAQTPVIDTDTPPREVAEQPQEEIVEPPEPTHADLFSAAHRRHHSRLFSNSSAGNSSENITDRQRRKSTSW